MAAIAEAIVAALAFICEALVWSLVGFVRLCRAAFSRSGRAEVSEKWRSGMRERVAMVGAVALWIPLAVIGFGIGLPLLYGFLTDTSKKESPLVTPKIGEAVIVVPHPTRPDTETILRIDRSRLSEIKATKDLVELAKKLREISVVEDEKRPNKAPEPTPGAVTPRATESNPK